MSAAPFKRSVKVLTGELIVSESVMEKMRADPTAFTQWADKALAETKERITLMDEIDDDAQQTSDRFNGFDEESDVLDHDEYQRLLGLWRMAREGSGTALPIQNEARAQLAKLLSKHAITVDLGVVCRCASVDALADVLAPAMAAKSTVDDDGGRFGSRVTGGPAVDAGLKGAFASATLRT